MLEKLLSVLGFGIEVCLVCYVSEHCSYIGLEGFATVYKDDGKRI